MSAGDQPQAESGDEDPWKAFKAVIVLGVVGFAVAIWAVMSIFATKAPHNPEPALAPAKSLAQIQREIAAKALAERVILIGKLKLKIDLGWNGVGLIYGKGTIKNPASVAGKDIEIECQIFAKSGTLLQKVSATLYEVVKPGQVITFSRLGFGIAAAQAHGSRCEIVDAKLV